MSKSNYNPDGLDPDGFPPCLPSPDFPGPITPLISFVGMASGGYLGYHYAPVRDALFGTVLGGFIGAFVLHSYAAVAFAQFLEEGSLKPGETIREYVCTNAIIFFVAATAFVIFTPQSFRGGYFGYADPFTPLALGIWGVFALTRLIQSRSPGYLFDRHVAMEGWLFGIPLALLGLLVIFTAFMWHLGQFPTEILP